MEQCVKDTIKCHKCRHIVISDASVVAVYNNPICGTKDCQSYNTKRFLYLIEEKLPPWVKLKVEDENWTKGKLHCENCRFKIGSFDFVSGRKCDCGLSVLPPVHLVASQVDRPLSLEIGNKTNLNNI